jgi:hypothetical protein
MLPKFAYAVLAGALLAIVPARVVAVDGPYTGDLGSAKWFEMMRKAGYHSAMLRALAGSNGQIAIPPDCVEVSVVVTAGGGGPYKGKLPNVRIISTDDRVDNVPRQPFIMHSANEPPNFYTVLKRDLNYQFYWNDNVGNEDHFATWRVPPDAPKQVRLVFAVDPGGRTRISVYSEKVRAAK